MTEPIRVCAAADVAPGSVIGVLAGDVPLAVARTEDDEFFAIDDECSHAAIALSEGEVSGATLECWLHGSRFDLRTGKPTGLPATEPVAVYPVDVRDGDVYVTLAQTNGTPTNGTPSDGVST